MTAPLTDLRIGFIGLGLMGRPMCLNLHRAGASLVVHNRTLAVAQALQQPRIEVASSPAEVAAAVDIVVLMLADTEAVEAVLFGDKGLADRIKAGSLVIDMGSTAATATREFAQKLQQKSVEFIDAPVSGGEIGAINGDLVIMAGGTGDAINRAKPLFEVVGKSFVHIGKVGTGQITKAANQIIVGLNIGAVAEALTLAKRAGADIARVREALLGGFAASRILEVHGQRMIDETFQPGAKITTQNKDLVQALELAAELQQSLPATRLNQSLYDGLIKQGKGDLDHSALILALDENGQAS